MSLCNWESSRNLNLNYFASFNKQRETQCLDIPYMFNHDSRRTSTPIKTSVADKGNSLQKMNFPEPVSDLDDSRATSCSKESFNGFSQHLNSSHKQTKSFNCDVVRHDTPRRVPAHSKQQNEVCELSAKRSADGIFRLHFNLHKPIQVIFDPDSLDVKCTIGPLEEPACMVSDVLSKDSVCVSNKQEPCGALSSACKRQKVREIPSPDLHEGEDCCNSLKNPFVSINYSHRNLQNKTYTSDIEYLGTYKCPEKGKQFQGSHCELSTNDIEKPIRIRKRFEKSHEIITLSSVDIVEHSHINKSLEASIPKQRSSLKTPLPIYEPNLQDRKPCLNYRKQRLKHSKYEEIHIFDEDEMDLNPYELNNKVINPDKILSDFKLGSSVNKSAEVKSCLKHSQLLNCFVSLKRIDMPKGNQTAVDILPVEIKNTVDTGKSLYGMSTGATDKALESSKQSLEFGCQKETRALFTDTNAPTLRRYGMVEGEKLSDLDNGGFSHDEQDLVMGDPFDNEVSISSGTQELDDNAEINDGDELIRTIERSSLNFPRKRVRFEDDLSKSDSKSKTEFICNDKFYEKASVSSKLGNKSGTPYGLCKVPSIDSKSNNSFERKEQCSSEKNTLGRFIQEEHSIIHKLQNDVPNAKVKRQQKRIGTNDLPEYRINMETETIEENVPQQVDVQKEPSLKKRKPLSPTKYLKMPEKGDLEKDILLHSILADITEESLSRSKLRRSECSLVKELVKPENFPDCVELLLHVLKYLCLSRKNPLATYPTAKKYLPVEEKCIVTALREIECMKKPHLQGLLKSALKTLHELVLSKKGYNMYGLGSLCRLLTELCRRNGDSSGPVNLCCDLLKVKHEFAPFLVASIGGVWKGLFLVTDDFSDEEKVLHSAIKCGALKRTKDMLDSAWSVSSKFIEDCFTAPKVPDERKAIEFLMNRFRNKGISADSYDSGTKLATALVIFAAHQDWDWLKEQVLDKYVVRNLQPRRSKEEAFRFYCDLYVDIILIRPDNDEILFKMLKKVIKMEDNFVVQSTATVALIKVLLKWNRGLPDFLKSFMEEHQHDARLQLAEIFFRRRMISDRFELSGDDILKG